MTVMIINGTDVKMPPPGKWDVNADEISIGVRMIQQPINMNPTIDRNNAHLRVSFK
jgi:hypothetical protein